MEAPAEGLFHPIHHTRVADAIVAQVRALIAAHHLQPGDHLPPERDLAETLGVGRSALREALRTLESLRVIETNPGKGTVLSTAAPLTILPGVVASADGHAALLETRLLIEPQIAALAARRGTPEEHDEGRHLLAARAASAKTGGSGTTEDLAFHHLLCRMARNPLLLQLRDGLVEALRAGRTLSLSVPGRAEASVREHETILAAVEARDADDAQARMLAHLTAAGHALVLAQAYRVASPSPPENRL